MLTRYVSTAYKIGACFLAKQKGLDLGPFSRGVGRDEIKPSSVLVDMLCNYCNNERVGYFQLIEGFDLSVSFFKELLPVLG